LNSYLLKAEELAKFKSKGENGTADIGDVGKGYD
jgi:hypothetical protein